MGCEYDMDLNPTGNNYGELYDPATGMFTLTPAVGPFGCGLTSTLLDTGNVLCAGGDMGLSLCVEYDPGAGNFLATSGMNDGRYDHTATKLADGTVLAAGGYGTSALLSSAEIYTP